MTVKPRHCGPTLSEPNIIVRVFEGNDFWVKKNRQMAGLFGKDLCYTEVRKSSPPKILEFCSLQRSKNETAAQVQRLHGAAAFPIE
jgi:hypothetical protein